MSTPEGHACGYNLTGLVFYTLNAILLYFVLLRLFQDRVPAFLAAGFFVCGSVGADAVLWKATNSSLFCLFFYLSALYAYTAFRTDHTRGKYVLALLLFCLSMFSKEEAASFPMTACLIDILFYNGWHDKKRLIARIAPFCAIIVLYLVGNGVVFNYVLQGHAEPQKLFKFRPLYSLLGGGTAFFLSPDGFIRTDSLPVYLTAFFFVLSFWLKRVRRMLIFGWLWVFIAFLPQSLTGLGQFEPRVIVNSISRYLYITSIGSSIVFAAVITGLREWVPLKAWAAAAGTMLLLFIWVHHSKVASRGEEWQGYGTDMRDFIIEMKRTKQVFPAPSHVHVVNGPAGRAFIQQALRAFYENPDIHWVDSVKQAQMEGKSPLFVVLYQTVPGKAVEIGLVQ